MEEDAPHTVSPNISVISCYSCWISGMLVFPTAHKILSTISEKYVSYQETISLKTGSCFLLPFHQLRQGKGIKRHQNLCRITEKNQTQHRVLGPIRDVSAFSSLVFPSPRYLSFTTDCKVTSSTTFVPPKHFPPMRLLTTLSRQSLPGCSYASFQPCLCREVQADTPSTGNWTTSHEIYCQEKNVSGEYMKIIGRKLPLLFSGKSLNPQFIAVRDQRSFLPAVKQPKFYSSCNWNIWWQPEEYNEKKHMGT